LAANWGFYCHEQAEINILPALAAYIGADITAGITSIQPGEDQKRFLYIDIGTNGEMALVTPGKTWCCATAAGPAFEGATIQCGMTAMEGAVYAFDGTEARVIGNTAPRGFAAPGSLTCWLIWCAKSWFLPMVCSQKAISSAKVTKKILKYSYASRISAKCNWQNQPSWLESRVY
jgi:hypothetical protein